MTSPAMAFTPVSVPVLARTTPAAGAAGPYGTGRQRARLQPATGRPPKMAAQLRVAAVAASAIRSVSSGRADPVGAGQPAAVGQAVPGRPAGPARSSTVAHRRRRRRRTTPGWPWASATCRASRLGDHVVALGEHHLDQPARSGGRPTRPSSLGAAPAARCPRHRGGAPAARAAWRTPARPATSGCGNRRARSRRRVCFGLGPAAPSVISAVIAAPKPAGGDVGVPAGADGRAGEQRGVDDDPGRRGAAERLLAPARPGRPGGPRPGRSRRRATARVGSPPPTSTTSPGCAPATDAGGDAVGRAARGEHRRGGDQLGGRGGRHRARRARGRTAPAGGHVHHRAVMCGPSAGAPAAAPGRPSRRPVRQRRLAVHRGQDRGAAARA